MPNDSAQFSPCSLASAHVVTSKAGTIIFVLAVLAVAGWWAHDKYRDTTEANARKKHRTALEGEFKSATFAAAQRHDAIIDWEKAFAAPLSEPFSIQLQDILASAKPIVISGVVEDVARHEGHSYLYLNDENVTGATIRFVLECDAANVRRIVEKREAFESVSVIAKIDSVEKAQVALSSGGKTSEDTEPIEVDSSSLFVAHGKCLEILFSGE